MIYRDVWLKPDWLEIFRACQLAGFGFESAVSFIERGLPPVLVVDKLIQALAVVQ